MFVVTIESSSLRQTKNWQFK